MPISSETRHRIQAEIDTLRMPIDIGCMASMSDLDLDLDLLLDDDSDTLGEDSLGFGAEVTKRVLEWRETALPNFRALSAFATLCISEHCMREFLWSITGPLVEEYLYQKGWPLQKTIYGNDVERIAFDAAIPDVYALKSPDMIETVLNRDPVLLNYVNLLRDQHKRIVQALTCFCLPGFIRWTKANRAPPRSPPVVKIAKRKRNQQRKAIRRGVRAMTELIAPDAYRRFTTTDGLIIHGQLFDYRVTKTHNLFTPPPSHNIPYQLNLLNQQGGRLAEGCVVFADTPMLDQVIALALHVHDQETEIELLKATNWIFTDAAIKDDFYRQFGSKVPEDTGLATVLTDFELTYRPSLRFFRRRKWIMDRIQPEVTKTLARITGIPIAAYQFMSQQNNFDRLIIDYHQVHRVRGYVMAPTF